MKILGIDPGSNITGFGVIEISINNSFAYFTSGTIKLNKQPNFLAKIDLLYQDLDQLIKEVKPSYLATENIFMAINPQAAIKLGPVRGAIMLCAIHNNLKFKEFFPKSVKKAITNKGNATKYEVRNTITNLMKLNKMPSNDSADALAIAICCGFIVCQVNY